MRIYLDNATSTKVDDRVIEAMLPFFKEYYALPSSQFTHSYGMEVNDLVSNAREFISQKIGGDAPEEIIFTSGGTEANNLAIKGIAYANQKKGKHIVTTSIEHLSVVESTKRLEKEGFEITFLPVDQNGYVNIETLSKSLRDDTILVSIQMGNHETGTLQNIKEISKIVKQKNITFHTDAAITWPYTKDIEINNIDLMTISPHKFHGPKGIGILYAKKGSELNKIIDGGYNENNLRAGSENTPGIIGAMKALEIFSSEDVDKIIKLRNYLKEKIEQEVEDVEFNTPTQNSLPHILNCTFKYVEGEAISLRLDFEGIAVTTGSACYSRNLQASYILLAMGRTHEQSHGSIRFSLSKYNTKEEIDYTVNRLKEIIKNLRKLSPLGKE
jgi:cysteine desulfurase